MFRAGNSRDNWSDLAFYATLGDRIERMAIVGAERWRKPGLDVRQYRQRRAPVEFSAGSTGGTDAASVWVTA